MSDLTLRLDDESLKRDPDEVFDTLEKIGEGSYGSVHKAVHHATGTVVAIKKVAVDSELREIIKEISIMQQCDSEAIVKYYGSYFKGSELWIVMEYCGAGSVVDIMRLRKQPMSEEQIACILTGTLRALKYLHDRRKIHRDIKAGNILLNNDGEAKLADFGVAGSLSDTMAKRNTVIGTPFWMAPEVIQEVGYDTKADIWSLGITIIEMAEGKPPHADIHPMRAIFMIPTHPPPTLKKSEQFSSDFKDFLSKCLQKDPKKRWTATQLLEHTLIVNAKKPAVVLADAIEEAARVLEAGGEAEAEEQDEDASVETGTMVSTGETGTMVVRSGGKGVHGSDTQQVDASSAEAAGTLVTKDMDTCGSMVVHDEQQMDDTMKDSSGDGNAQGYKPAFLEHFEQLEETEPKPLPASLAQVTQLKQMNIKDLKTRLASLDGEMERELSELKQLYQYKREPILAAIERKKQMVASS